jgi:hypothetical protein
LCREAIFFFILPSLLVTALLARALILEGVGMAGIKRLAKAKSAAV